MICPNKNTKEWADLTAITGSEENAYLEWILNGKEIPSKDKLIEKYGEVDNNSATNHMNFLNNIKDYVHGYISKGDIRLNDLNVENSAKKVEMLAKAHGIDVAFSNSGMSVDVNIGTNTHAITGEMFKETIHKMSKLIPGLKYQALPETMFEEIKREKGVDDNSITFIHGNTIYFNNNATYESYIPFEECLHPIVHGIEKQNPELFETLLNEAKEEYPDIWKEVKRNYKSNRENELVTKALAKIMSSRKNESLYKRVLFHIRNFFSNLFGYKTDDVVNSLNGVIRELNLKSGKFIPLYTNEITFSNILEYVKDRTELSSMDSIEKKILKKARNIGYLINEKLRNSDKHLKQGSKNVYRNLHTLSKKLDDKQLDVKYDRNSESDNLNRSKYIIGETLVEVSNRLNTISDRLISISDKIETIDEEVFRMLHLIKVYDIDWSNSIIKEMSDILQADGFGNTVKNISSNEQKTLNELYSNINAKLTQINEIYRKINTKALINDIKEIQGYITEKQHQLIVKSIEFGGNEIAYFNFLQLKHNSNSFLLNMVGKIIDEYQHEVDQTFRERLTSIENRMKELAKKHPIYFRDIHEKISEKDENGNKTGYMISKVNRGIAEREYKKDLQKLYKELSNKYKVEITDVSDLYKLSPEGLREYEQRHQEIESEHYTTKFSPEYLKIKASLSPETRAAIDEINHKIYAIVGKYTDENGVFRQENMGSSDMKLFHKLRNERRNLSLTTDELGYEKTGEDLKIALELQEYNQKIKEIVEKNNSNDFENQSFKNTINQLVENYKENPTSENLNAYWFFVQTKSQEIYSDEFYKEMEDYFNKVELPHYGEEYEKLRNRKNAILKHIRKSYNNQPNVDLLSDEQRQELLSIMREMEDIRESNRQKVEKNKVKKPFEELTTPEYNRDKQRYENNEPGYENWFNENHYTINTEMGPMTKPYPWYTYNAPKNKNHITLKPNHLFEESANESGLLNPEYNEHIGHGVKHPRLDKYYNSEFEKIQEHPDYKEMYDIMFNLLKSSKSLQRNHVGSDLYLLPQQVGGFKDKMKYARNAKWYKKIPLKLANWFSLYFKPTTAKGEYTKDLDKNGKKDRRFALNYHADFQNVNNLQVPYNDRLEDANILTRDMYGSLLNYYYESVKFSKKQKYLPKALSIKEQIANSDLIKKGNILGRTDEDDAFMEGFSQNRVMVKGIESRAYSKISDRIDSIFFGSRNDLRWMVGDINLGAPLRNLLRAITNANLSFNLPGIIKDMIGATLSVFSENLLVNQYTSRRTSLKAFYEWLKMSKDVLMNIGSDVAASKRVKLMQHYELQYEVRDQFKMKRFDSNTSGRIWRAIHNPANTLYAGWSHGSLALQSYSLINLLMNQKLITEVNGEKIKPEILDRELFLKKYYANNRKEGKKAWKKIKGNLYDELMKKTTEKGIQLEGEWAEAYNNKTDLRIKSTADMMATRLEGKLSESDKTIINTSLLGQFTFQHRNWLYSVYDEMFASPHYDFRTHQIQMGAWTAMWIMVKNLWLDLTTKNESGRRFNNTKKAFEDVDQYSIYNKVSKFAIRTLLSYMMFHMIFYFLLTPLARWIADDEDDWFEGMEKEEAMVAYITRSAESEIASKMGTFTVLAELINDPLTSQKTLLQIFQIDQIFDNDVIKKGPWKGVPKSVRYMFKFIPGRHFYEHHVLDNKDVYNTKYSKRFPNSYLDSREYKGKNKNKGKSGSSIFTGVGSKRRV